MEGCGNAKLTVVRSGPELDRTCFVDYKTLDGSATASNDYEYTEGTLCFKVSHLNLLSHLKNLMWRLEFFFKRRKIVKMILRKLFSVFFINF